jgi:hypothetical protein
LYYSQPGAVTYQKPHHQRVLRPQDSLKNYIQDIDPRESLITCLMSMSQSKTHGQLSRGLAGLRWTKSLKGLYIMGLQEQGLHTTLINMHTQLAAETLP